MKKVRFYERLIKAAIKRIHKALKYSYEGVKAMYKSEPSFQQDLVLFFVGMLVLCFLDITTTQKCILIILRGIMWWIVFLRSLIAPL